VRAFLEGQMPINFFYDGVIFHIPNAVANPCIDDLILWVLLHITKKNRFFLVLSGFVETYLKEGMSAPLPSLPCLPIANLNRS